MTNTATTKSTRKPAATRTPKSKVVARPEAKTTTKKVGPAVRKAVAESKAAEAAERAAAAVTVDPATLDRIVALGMAKAENQALRDWKAAGADDATRPATPVLDWMTSGGTKAPKARRTSTRVSTATFQAADHPDGFTCTTCGVSKPVQQFPTTNGPAVRATRCRKCRDGAKTAVAA